MNKFLFKFFIASFFISVIFAEVSYAAKYNCNWTSTDGYFHFATYSSSDTANAHCNWLKGNNYTKCVKDFNETVKAYKAGKCEEVLEKHYKINNCDCTIEYGKKTNKSYGYSCSGINSDSAMTKIKEIAKTQYK